MKLFGASTKRIFTGCFLFLSFLTQSLYAQNVDSLVSVFDNKKLTDEVRLDALKAVKWTGYNNTVSEGMVLIKKAEVLAEINNDQKALASFAEGKGILARREGNLIDAEKYFLESIKHAEAGNLHRSKFMMYIRMASIFAQKGNLETQKKWLLKIESDPRSKELKDIRAMAISEMGMMLTYSDENRNAIPYFKQAIAMQESLNDLPNLAYEQGNMARTYWNLGEMDSAYFWYYQTLTTQKKMESAQGVAGTYYNLGLAYLGDVRYDSAIQLFVKAEKLFGSLGMEEGRAMAIEALGNVYAASGKHKRALKHFKEAVEILEKGESIYYLIEAYGSLANGYKSLGNIEESIKYYLKALELAKEVNSPLGIVSKSNELGKLYLSKNNISKAESFTNAALDAALVSQNLMFVSDAWLSKARIEKVKGVYKVSNKYIDSVFNYGPNLSASLEAYQIQSYNLEKLNSYEAALVAKNKYLELLDSSRVISNKKIEKEALSKYAVEKAETNLVITEGKLEISNAIAAKERQKKYFGFILALLAILSIVLIVLRHKKYKKEKEKTTKLQIEAAEKNVIHAQEILRNQSGLILDKNRIIKELKSTVDTFFGSDQKSIEKFDHFLEKNILTKEDWKSFKDKFGLIYPDFEGFIKEKYSVVTPAEYRFLCLIKLELTLEEMSDMLGILPRSMERTILRFKSKHDLESSDLGDLVI